MRYLTGFTLADGEEKVAGHSGQFLVTRRRGRGPGRLPLHDPGASRGAGVADRRRLQRPAGALARAARVGRCAAGRGRGRVRVAGHLEPARSPPRRTSSWCRSRAGSRADRGIKEPAELERVAAACAVADRALATLLPEIRPGVTETELALRLEWLIRTGGAEALAFDVACLSGPEAALPHGSPGDRPVIDGTVLLFDFGAQVAGYRSDMTRTLFVGEPAARDLDDLRLVATAQSGAIERLAAAVAGRDGPAAERTRDRRRRARRHRGGRSRGALRPRHGARDRPRHPRNTVARQVRAGRAVAQPDRLLGRARRLSRGRDRASGSRTWSCSTPPRAAWSGSRSSRARSSSSGSTAPSSGHHDRDDWHSYRRLEPISCG